MKRGTWHGARGTSRCQSEAAMLCPKVPSELPLAKVRPSRAPCPVPRAPLQPLCP